MLNNSNDVKFGAMQRHQKQGSNTVLILKPYDCQAILVDISGQWGGVPILPLCKTLPLSDFFITVDYGPILGLQDMRS